MWFLFVAIDENFNMIFFRFIMIGVRYFQNLFILVQSIRNGRQDEVRIENELTIRNHVVINFRIKRDLIN